MKENNILELQYSGRRSKACHSAPWWMDSPASMAPKPLEIKPETVAQDDETVDLALFPKFDDAAADQLSSIFTCRRCGSHAYRDVAIHKNRSVRRDCGECGAFNSFPVWYGGPKR